MSRAFQHNPRSKVIEGTADVDPSRTLPGGKTHLKTWPDRWQALRVAAILITLQSEDSLKISKVCCELV